MSAIRFRTKGELFAKYASYQSARSAIAKHAKKEIERARTPKVCCVCGYSLHVETAHLRAVADFPDSAEISEINCTTNLIYLCPNHHWEYDNGHLAL
jgi:predicted restriction endonuclease